VQTLGSGYRELPAQGAILREPIAEESDPKGAGVAMTGVGMPLTGLCVGARRGVLLLLVAAQMLGGALPVSAEEPSPFSKVAGRWLGEGRLGIRDGPTEQVKCRVTYILQEQGTQVRQTIRCATESGSVEVQSTVTHASGTLTGTWKELSRNWSGELTGSASDNGFKVAITGSELNANMAIIVKDARQIIEIQFINSSLIGLTLVLTRG
jgi:hypothetical protein